MSASLEISEAKNRIDELLARARAGEEIVLSDAGEPVAKIGPVSDNPRARALGTFKGQVWMSDDFEKPLTDGELKDWERVDENLLPMTKAAGAGAQNGMSIGGQRSEKSP